MLDHFVIGRVDRISPEAPVPVVQFDHESYRLGGAANVAHNVAALGGRVEIAGLVGNDAEGARLVGELREAGIGTAGVLADAQPLHDAQAARRDHPQPAGRAHRLRVRHAGARGARSGAGEEGRAKRRRTPTSC